ncbi:hypothetical protein ABBQ32_001427 [Trebouxia sp. C0010 RCD-2024]
MYLELVETGYEDKKVKAKTKESNPAKQAAKILKNIVVQQLSLYWKASNDAPPSKTSSMESDAWLHVEHPPSTAGVPAAASPAHQPSSDTQKSNASLSVDGMRPDVVLVPTKCELTISMSSDKHTGVTRIGADAKVDRLQATVAVCNTCSAARPGQAVAPSEAERQVSAHLEKAAPALYGPVAASAAAAKAEESA